MEHPVQDVTIRFTKEDGADIMKVMDGMQILREMAGADARLKVVTYFNGSVRTLTAVKAASSS